MDGRRSRSEQRSEEQRGRKQEATVCWTDVGCPCGMAPIKERVESGPVQIAPNRHAKFFPKNSTWEVQYVYRTQQHRSVFLKKYEYSAELTEQSYQPLQVMRIHFLSWHIKLGHPVAVDAKRHQLRGRSVLATLSGCQGQEH